MTSRKSGVLLHISSLPGDFGIGDLGPAARAFARELRGGGFSLWQILPLTPVVPFFGSSPYSSPSAFAGNFLFISPELMAEDGLLFERDLAPFRRPSVRRADYGYAALSRAALLKTAWERFKAEPAKFVALDEDMALFKQEASGWLREWSRYSALREKFGGECWADWPEEFAARGASALAAFEGEAAAEIDFLEFVQFIFYRQLTQLVDFCRGLGVALMGDLPIYVAWDGADVWSHRGLFQLDEEGRPRCVAGVPPDYFSPTGQRWGNPLYDWSAMSGDRFAWWRSRMSWWLRFCGQLRVDHFRGLCGYWSIPASEETAVNGRWERALGADMLAAFHEIDMSGAPLPVVAEDLGIITDDVRALMDEYSLPGMKVLMFAFGGDVGSNPYAPHNIQRRSVVYTGTHDNDTAAGWWSGSSTEEERGHFALYSGCSDGCADAARGLVRMALSSPAETAIIPAQDLLALDGSCRMNVPAKKRGNWEWRLLPDELKSCFNGVKALNAVYGRAEEVC